MELLACKYVCKRSYKSLHLVVVCVNVVFMATCLHIASEGNKRSTSNAGRVGQPCFHMHTHRETHIHRGREREQVNNSTFSGFVQTSNSPLDHSLLVSFLHSCAWRSWGAGFSVFIPDVCTKSTCIPLISPVGYYNYVIFAVKVNSK